MLKASLLGTAVAYYRVSSDEQRKGETIKGQSRYVRNWCQSREIVLAAEYRDDGDNGEGEFTEREGGAELWAAAQRGEFQTVVVFAVNRTGRTAYAALHMFHKLRKLGIRLISATEEFDPDEPTGRFLIAILAGKAESDKSTIRLHTETGKRTWQNTPDTYTGGKVPFGYSIERRGKRQYYVICRLCIPGGDCTPEDVILYIFRRCLEGIACPVIADELNARSITPCWVPGDTRYGTPSQARWSPQRVYQLLRNPFYKGVQYIGSGIKHRPVVRAEATPHAVPALVSPEVWDRAQSQLAKNRTLSDRNAQQFYLLRGKIVCLTCGKPYGGASSVGGFMPKGRYYRCCNTGGRRPYCPSRWLDAEETEQNVKQDILWILGHPEPFLDEIRQQLGSQTERTEQCLDEARALDRSRAELQKTRDEYVRLRAVGLIETDAKLQQFVQEVAEKENALIEQATALRNQAMQFAEADQRLRGAQSVLEAYHARAAQGFSDEEWRQLVDMLLDRIEVETQTVLMPEPRTRCRNRRKQATAHPYYRVGPLPTDKVTTGGYFINCEVSRQALIRLAA